ncbi:MAG TPA: hypothetical protein VL728_04885 [Cyclobacteriaceae bacterium]|jgi:hypothetical protein|nr:hypothetical protein [Cyclobacteriaceae bacterium]
MEKKLENVAATKVEPSNNPHNLKFPEIVTVTESNEKTEVTEEHKLTYKSGAPKGTMLVKKISLINKTVRTTTPYTGTV